MKKDTIISWIIWLFLQFSLTAVLVMTASLLAMGGVFFLLILPPATGFWNYLAGKKSRSILEFPATGNKRREEQGRIRLQFDGLPPVGRIYSRIRLKNELTGEEYEEVLPVNGSDDGYTALCRIGGGHCGRTEIRIENFLYMDLMGILPFRVRRSGTARVTILPDLYPARITGELYSRAVQDTENYQSDRKGSDFAETYQLREYVPGDNLHGIHWKLSSKIGKMIYREPGEPVDESLLLFWNPGNGTPEVMDALAEVIFSVGGKFCEEGYSYTLGYFDGGMPVFTSVRNQEELLAEIPAILWKNQNSDGNVDLERYGRVLYFTAAIPHQELPEQTILFYCNEHAVREENRIGFTPDNYKEVLQKLDFS